ncbi:MAG: 2-polyprenylphenol 6-hydroxylase [Neomegalonema sp.]|nr:2-polyprenylphenol 6-hydroxylase [Neomegalonema sp.]
MSMFSDLFRLVRIAATLRRTGGLSVLLGDAYGFSMGQRRVINAVLWPLIPFGARGDQSLPPVARAASALGPSHVKFGQVLSTRPDIAGEALSTDLRHLQDKLPPFDMALARKTIEKELEAPVDTLFAEFDPPIAAASIAQVHRAVLKDGRVVAVKVLRPNIERAFARDISAFYFVARLLERLVKKSKRLKPVEVVRHFEGVVTREMDLRTEAAAGSEYAQITERFEGFRTPTMIWEHCSRRVLVSGWVEGTRLGDVPALRAAGHDLEQMAQRIMAVFINTALHDGYFHADMHQGNMKVEADGTVVAYDFGIMGRLDAKSRRVYAEILFAYLNRDYRRGAQAHFDAGYVSREHDLEQFAQALRSIGEPIFGRDAASISMARLLQQLFDVTERFGMETRPELILLQRSMVVVEGVVRSLDPDFNMWHAARPVVEGWMKANLGPAAIARDLGTAALRLSRLGPQLPDLADKLVAMATDEDYAAAQSLRSPPHRSQPPYNRHAPRTGIGRWVAFGLACTLLGAAGAFVAIEGMAGVYALFGAQ